MSSVQTQSYRSPSWKLNTSWSSVRFTLESQGYWRSSVLNIVFKENYSRCEFSSAPFSLSVWENNVSWTERRQLPHLSPAFLSTAVWVLCQQQISSADSPSWFLRASYPRACKGTASISRDFNSRIWGGGRRERRPFTYSVLSSKAIIVDLFEAGIVLGCAPPVAHGLFGGHVFTPC